MIQASSIEWTPIYLVLVSQFILHGIGNLHLLLSKVGIFGRKKYGKAEILWRFLKISWFPYFWFPRSCQLFIWKGRSHSNCSKIWKSRNFSKKNRLLESRLEFKTPFCTQMSGHLNLFAYSNILFLKIFENFLISIFFVPTLLSARTWTLREIFDFHTFLYLSVNWSYMAIYT